MTRIFKTLAWTLLALFSGAVPGESAIHGFEENRGQAPPGAAFLARFGPFQVRATPNGLQFVAPNQQSASILVVGATVNWQPDGAAIESINYQIGADSSRWANGVLKYSRIRAKNILPGIDWLVYWNGADIEYDFELAPHADLAALGLRFDGINALSLDPHHGSLSGRIGSHSWRQKPPRFFADHARELGGRLVEYASGQYGFQLSSPRPPGPLRVDPVIEFVGVLGGVAEEYVAAATRNMVLGVTRSNNWQSAEGARSGSDIFHTRFLLGGIPTTTFWGGEGDEELSPVHVEAPSPGQSLSFFVAGWTTSRTLSNLGSALALPRWRFGGGESDGLLVIATESSLFVSAIAGPGSERYRTVVTTNVATFLAGETTVSGRSDTQGLVSMFNGSEFVHWIGGGRGRDCIQRLHLVPPPPSSSSLPGVSASFGQLLFAGETSSDDVLVESGSTVPSWSRRGGDVDVWLGALKVASAGLPRPAWMGVYGGPAQETVSGTALLTDRGFLIAGSTNSNNLPMRDAPQDRYGGGDWDGFILQVSVDGREWLRSSYWGGEGSDRIVNAGAISGDLAIVGESNSTVFASLKGDPQGRADGFAALLDWKLRSFWSTRVGGASDDTVSVAILNDRKLILAGTTLDSSWVSSTGAQTISSNGSNSVASSPAATDVWVLTQNLTLLPGTAIIVGRNLQTTPSWPTVIGLESPGALNIAVADPSLLRLSLPLTLGESEMLLSLSIPLEQSFNQQAAPFRIQAFDTVGDTELVITGDGFSERRIQVKVVPAVLVTLGQQDFSGPPPFFALLRVGVAPLSPITGQPLAIQRLRDGFSPPTRLVSGREGDFEMWRELPASIARDTGDFSFQITFLREAPITILPVSDTFPTASLVQYKMSLKGRAIPTQDEPEG